MGCDNHLHRIGGICCHKIIPLVFDQSYSYYEQLCAFLNKLNELVDAVNLQNMTISEFENEINELFNQFKNEMRIAFSDFQIEMRQEFEDFTAQITTEWNAYKTDLTQQWENEKAINAAFRSDMQSAWTSYQTELNASFEIFKSQETAARQAFQTTISQRQDAFETTERNARTTFETAQTQRQQNFENSITTQQDNFENDITDQQNDFETTVNERLDGFSSIDYCSYFGAFNPMQTEPPTIPTIASSPLSGSDLVVRVYYKSAESSSFEFLKRMRYDDLMTDSSIPAWTASNQAFWIIFENPVVWEWIKSGITPYGAAARNFTSDYPRLQIRSFNEISNDKISLANSILLGSYNLPRGVIDTPYSMTTTEEPMTAHEPYTFCGFGFYAGLKPGSIQTITQPTGATTQVKPGYVYDGFSGGIVRDPKITEIESKINSSYIYQTAGGTSTKTITLDPSAAYVVFLTYGSWCNVYFLNSTTTRAYIKTVVDQMSADITATYTDLSVTFTSTAGNAFTLFAKKFSV